MRALGKKSDPLAWSGWVDGLHQSLAEAKELLLKPRSVDLDWLQAAMRAFHLIKGYAQALGLHGVQSVAHELESVIQREIEAQGNPLIPRLLEGVKKLDAVLGRLHDLQLPFAAMEEMGRRANRGSMRLRDLMEAIAEAARGIAINLDKAAEIDVQASGDIQLLPSWQDPLEAALLHALRNCLDHGTRGLSRKLRIQLRAKKKRDELVIECVDDGSGIDPQRVRGALLGKRRRFEAEVRTMSDDEVLQQLFLPGLSLSETVTPLSGRGYGLDIVRDVVETRLVGKVRIESAPGRGVCLTMSFPFRATPKRGGRPPQSKLTK